MTAKNITMDDVAEEGKALGIPLLNVFKNHFPPSLISKTFRVLNIVNKEPYEHLTPAEVTVIASVVSSANGCEI